MRRAFLLAGVPFPLSLLAAQEPPTVHLTEAGPDREVHVGDELFTIYRTDGTPRQPVLYPVLGPGQAPMTRRYPLEDAAPGEAKNHPHHRSLWFAHGALNGVDFELGLRILLAVGPDLLLVRRVLALALAPAGREVPLADEAGVVAGIAEHVGDAEPAQVAVARIGCLSASSSVAPA